MPSARSTLWSLIGVVLTLAARALIVHRVAGGPAARWLPLTLLVISTLALGRR